MSDMMVQVLEYSQARVADGIIHNVKIVGTRSKNNRRYPQEVLERHANLYEGAAVYLFHPDAREKKKGSRQLDHHFGALFNVRPGYDGTVGTGLFGDLLVKQSHPLAGMILESDGRQFGLSHNAVVEMDDDGTVTRIVAINSVDLVDNPATTTNLFEGTDMELNEMQAALDKSAAATDARIAAIDEKLTAVLEALEKKPEPPAKPPEKKDRLAMLEPAKPVLEQQAEPIGNTHEDLLDVVRGCRTTKGN